MAFDVIIRALFTDSGLSAGLASANAKLAQLGRSGPGARAGLRAAEMGMRSLAFEAAGLGGPMGRVAAGLLQLGGGSALVLGAVAGVGAIAAAYKLSAQSAEDAIAATDRLNQSYRDIIGRGKPLVALQNEIIAAQDVATKAQEKFNEMQGRFATPLEFALTGRRVIGGSGTAGERALARNELDAANRVVDALKARSEQTGVEAARTWVREFMGTLKDLTVDEQLARLTANRTAFESRGTEAADAWRKAFMQIFLDHPPVIRPVVQTEVLEPGRARVIGPTGRIEATGRELAPRRLQFPETPVPVPSRGDTALDEFRRIQEQSAEILRSIITPQQQFNAAMEILRQSIEFGAMTAEERTETERRLAEAMGVTSRQARITAAQMVTAFSGLAAMFISGGDAGGILSGVGGVVGLFNPLAGAIVGGFGQIVSANDRNHRESMERLGQIVQNTDTRQRPQNVGVHVYVDGQEITDRVMYEIGRATRRDATPRLPPR